MNSKGKGKATYYVAGNGLSTPPQDLSTPPQDLNTPPQSGFSTSPLEISTPPPENSTPPLEISEEIQAAIKGLRQKEHDTEKVKSIIKKLCAIKPLKSVEVAEILGKRDDYIKRKFLGPMIQSKELKYLHPEMINHPEQAYITNKKD